MEVRNYRGWALWVYAMSDGSYCIRCLSPDGEIYTDWQQYPSSEVAVKAAKRLIDQDKLDVRRLAAIIGLMPQGTDHTIGSETQTHQKLAALECQVLVAEVGAMGNPMLGILACASLAYLHARIDRRNSR